MFFSLTVSKKTLIMHACVLNVLLLTVSIKTLIMHACSINVFSLTVSQKTLIMHACIINVLLLTIRQVKNLGCGSHAWPPTWFGSVGFRVPEPHPKFLTWRVVSKRTLIMHACTINVFSLTVSKRQLIMHACILNVLLLTIRQVKNLGCGSHAWPPTCLGRNVGFRVLPP